MCYKLLSKCVRKTLQSIYISNFHSLKIIVKVPTPTFQNILKQLHIEINNLYFLSTVPPVIIESATSSDMVVREGTNVTLTCKAKGYPEPYVMWRREDGDEMFVAGENGINFF